MGTQERALRDKLRNSYSNLKFLNMSLQRRDDPGREDDGEPGRGTVLGRELPRLLRGNHVGQGADHPGDDPLLHDLLADVALAAEGVEEGAVRASAPVLADREIDAD